MAINYGSRRVVAGAHYGTRDWLAQRATAVLIALFTFIVLAKLLLTSGPIGYETWAGVFENTDPRGTGRPVLPRVGRRSRHLDGLRQATWPSPRIACFHHRLARGLPRLGHSSSLEALSHDKHFFRGQAPF